MYMKPIPLYISSTHPPKTKPQHHGLLTDGSPMQWSACGTGKPLKVASTCIPEIILDRIFWLDIDSVCPYLFVSAIGIQHN